MTSVALNEDLIKKMRRSPNENTLTNDECIALNLFWRKRVKVPILAKAFRVSKNTIYYRALTGTADSYPTSIYANKAQEINTLIDKMGVPAAWRRYVTDEMVVAVNQAMAEEVERRGC